MNKQTADSDRALVRMATGVPALDEILKGGLFKGAVYIVSGTPGAGKTILANQICFHHARQGGRALFVTLLAEHHARMLQHLEQLSFYNARLIPTHIYYVSAFRVLEENGLKGLMELVRREMHAHQVDVFVLDGLITAQETSASDREFRKFIHELQGHAAAAECCTLLLTNGRSGEYHPEHTMVDGLIALRDIAYGKRRQRELEIQKFRGSSTLRGRHPFRISGDGVVIHPRPESRFLRNDAAATEERLSMGIKPLDDMMSGGPFAGSMTVLLGASGIGKTTLGTYFLAQSSEQQPGLHFGFYESPDHLLANAQRIGLDLRARVNAAHVEVLWRPPAEQILDSLGNEIIDAVRRRHVKRLFIDGWGGFAACTETPERLNAFFSAIANELRSLGATCVLAAETENLVGATVQMPTRGSSAVVENLILLRFTEYRARLRRLISIMKVRGGEFDPGLHEFKIDRRGVTIADSFENAEDILSGFGSERAGGAATATPRRRTKPRERG